MKGRGDIDEEGGERLADWIPVFVICLERLFLWNSAGLSTSLDPLCIARCSLVVWVKSVWTFSTTNIEYSFELCYSIMVLMIIIHVHVSKRNRSKSTTEMNTIDY